MKAHSTYNNGFRTDIQGLRAVAVGGVVLDHLNFTYFSGGFAGVDIFFVISGFLITDHLVRGLEVDGHIRFGEFYARRARRILPAALFVALLILIASMFFLPVTMRATSLHDAIATALYVPNYLFAYRASDYFANPAPSLYQHYWSLGVEEQFYLFWPLILATAYWLGIRASRKISCKLCSPRAALLAAVIIVGVISAWLNHRDLASQHLSRAFFWATGRAWEFAVGGLMALIASRLPDWWGRVALVRGGLSWIGLACITFAYVQYSGYIRWPGIYASLPVFGAALIVLSGIPKISFGSAGRLLEIQPLPWIGTISYSIYLVHWPLIQFVKASQGYFEGHLSLSVKLGLVALSILSAWVLYRSVENPVRFTPWLRSTRRTLFYSGASSLVVVVLAVGLAPIANYQLHHLILRHGDVSHISTLTAPPSDITPFVPRNLDPAIGAQNAGSWLFRKGCLVDADGHSSTTTPHPCYYGNTRLPRIALIGDSEAAAMGPALKVVAEKLGLSLQANAYSACEFLDTEPARPDCPAWRQKVILKLQQNPPDFIVIVQQGYKYYAPNSANREAEFKKGLSDFLAQIGQIPLVILQIPLPSGGDISTCLSTYLGTALKCSMPTQPAVKTIAHRAEAALAANHPGQVHLIDLTGYFCGPKSCPPIIGNTRVWLDNPHPTAAFAALLGPIIYKKLVGFGIASSKYSSSHGSSRG